MGKGLPYGLLTLGVIGTITSISLIKTAPARVSIPSPSRPAIVEKVSGLEARADQFKTASDTTSSDSLRLAYRIKSDSLSYVADSIKLSTEYTDDANNYIRDSTTAKNERKEQNDSESARTSGAAIAWLVGALSTIGSGIAAWYNAAKH